MAETAVQETRAAGGTPCLLNDLPMFDEGSAYAYIESTLEIIEALASRRLRPTCLYMSSSGKGQAGLLLAQELLGGNFKVRCVTATEEFDDIPARTVSIADRAARRLGLDVQIDPDTVDNDRNFIGTSYGVPSEAGNDAVRLFARTEGVILDPIYTGKCAAGMIAHILRGDFGPDDIVVFVHTGGTPAVFTHNHLWVP
jgi:D-cysteine desulfhydrase/L-cysteate sulfo-lyase